MLRLRYFSTTTIPVEAEIVTPLALAGKSSVEIARLPVQHGNASVPLGEIFHVEGDGDDEHIVIEGDCAAVKLVGAGMTSGRITIEGNIGMHVGAGMTGGTIDVHGNADDWAGAEMRGGTLRIRGNAGNLVGAGYRGSRHGMRGGTILVHGNAGHEVGSSMRRGLVAVAGNVGDFAGVSMIAGSLLLFGRTGTRTGAGMKRGTVAFFNSTPQLLPTFRFDCAYRPAFLRVYLRYLSEGNFPVPPELLASAYRRFSGDSVALGKGEILVRE